MQFTCSHPTYRRTCRGCRLKGRGYSGYAGSPLGRMVIVPEPPPLPVPVAPAMPGRSRALVTVAANREGRDLLAVSGPLMERYAERIGADLVVCDWPGNPAWPMSSKFAIVRALDRYERVAYLDAHVIVRPGARDLFAACQPEEVGFWNELPELLAESPSFPAEFSRFRQVMGFNHGSAAHPVPYYLNAGVMVFGQAHRSVFTLPDRPIPAMHCAEQHWWAARILAQDARVKLLPRECNWEWWVDRGFTRRAVPDDAILHFSGMGWEGHAARLAAMRQWAG